MRLLLIRHGQTPSNVERLLDTEIPGPGLTELGQEQADALPEALAEERIDAIYASTQIRSQLTAAPLASANGLSVQVRDGLREITAGHLEMGSDQPSIEQYLATIFAWSAGDGSLRMPGGESGAEALGRFEAVVGEAAAAGHATAALFSHGAVIRMWTAARAGNIDKAFVAEHGVSNTGVVVLEGDPAAGWHVTSWTGTAIGGPELADEGTDGPAGDAVPLGSERR